MLVVDVANLLGSRPDGWWRDRVGATQLLLGRLAGAGLGDVLAVVEGRAADVVDVAGVTVVRAAGSGDDEVVRQAQAHPGCTVVTADRGLRARLPEGTRVLGPGALRARLGEDGPGSSPPAPSPTPAELAAAAGRTTSPLVAPDLRVLFCGINPSLRTAWTGHHFAHPANRFWVALHLSGFTPRRLAPSEQHELLGLGLGVTNIASRASARASELDDEELREGGRRLAGEVGELRPRWLAVLGVTAYRTAFGERRAALGPQERTIGATRVWVLPNPSGLNAHHTPAQLGERFAELRAAVDTGEPGGPGVG